MSGPIAVLIADDHAVMRAGLRLLLESQADMRVVGECGTHRDVLAALHDPHLVVDVVTVDLTMPGGSGATLVQQVVRMRPEARVVVLTMHDDPAYARVAVAAGASAYVVKSAADTDLLATIRGVARRDDHGRPTLVGLAAQSQKHKLPTGQQAIDSLSEREREILRLIAGGHTNRQMADQLHLSVKTVESYRARLMAKLGLANRAELTQLAIASGLLGQGE